MDGDAYCRYGLVLQIDTHNLPLMRSWRQKGKEKGRVRFSSHLPPNFLCPAHCPPFTSIHQPIYHPPTSSSTHFRINLLSQSLSLTPLQLNFSAYQVNREWQHYRTRLPSWPTSWPKPPVTRSIASRPSLKPTRMVRQGVRVALTVQFPRYQLLPMRAKRRILAPSRRGSWRTLPTHILRSLSNAASPLSWAYRSAISTHSSRIGDGVQAGLRLSEGGLMAPTKPWRISWHAIRPETKRALRCALPSSGWLSISKRIRQASGSPM